MAENKYAKDETIQLVNEIVASTGTTRADLIPILQKVTNNLGYISQDAIKQISTLLKLPTKEIASVATFYRMLSTQPHGRHIIQFCESAPCHIVGGREVFIALKTALNLEPGETSTDNKWTFITTSCLGICGVGPVILIDTEIHGNVTPDQVPSILAKYA